MPMGPCLVGPPCWRGVKGSSNPHREGDVQKYRFKDGEFEQRLTRENWTRISAVEAINLRAFYRDSAAFYWQRGWFLQMHEARELANQITAAMKKFVDYTDAQAVAILAERRMAS